MISMRTRTKRMAIIAMLAALAYVIMVFGRIPVLTVPPYLKYDPKDVIITIGGFLFGPLSVIVMSAIVSIIEMLTVSDTGWIGALMNLVSTCAFACTAAVIYKYNRNLTGAIIGLLAGLICMVTVMLLWNYILTPVFLGYPREAVAAMLLPIFLPFNLLKGFLNAAITVLLYKPLKAALTASNLLPHTGEREKIRINSSLTITALFIIITGVLIILVYQGVI